MRYGLDPMEFLGQGREDHLISIAFINRAAEIETKQKIEEIELTAKLVGNEVLRGLSKVL